MKKNLKGGAEAETKVHLDVFADLYKKDLVLFEVLIKSARIVSPLSHFLVEPKVARCRSPLFNGSAIFGFSAHLA